MVDPAIVEQKAELLFPDQIFSRPINRLQTPQVGVIGGSRDNLKPLHDVYQALDACNNRTILAVPAEVSPIVGSLAELVFVQSEKYTDDATIAQRLADCNMIVLAPGMKVTSQWHIRLEKILRQSHTSAVWTEEALPIVAASPELLNAPGSIVVLSSEQAIRLANKYQLPVTIAPARGIYNKIALMRALSEHTNAHIVLCDEHQIATYHYTLSTAGLLQDAQHSYSDQQYILAGTIAGLTAGVVGVQRQYEAIMNALYIFREAMLDTNSDHAKSIRQAIDNII